MAAALPTSRCLGGRRVSLTARTTPRSVVTRRTTRRRRHRRRLVRVWAEVGGAGSGYNALRAGLSVAAITLGTKGLGLLREAALAAEFGVGPVAEGLAFASLLPGLAGVLLGGVNGAFHSALAAVASRLPPDRRKALLADVWARVGPITAGVAAGVVLLAGPIVRATAPGLSPEVSQLAAAQLAAMAPSIWLSARVGLGFGALSASGCFWLPAASSALSSTTTLAAVGAHHCLAHLLTPHSGAVLVASATSLGAGMQWGMQELGAIGKDAGASGAAEVVALLLPAAASMGVLQLAVLTDSCFASFEPGAAAAMGYANLLAMAPLGVLSSAVLLPALPSLSALAGTPRAFWAALADAALASLGASALLAAWLGGLAGPLVAAAFQRAAFDGAAAALTADLLRCYAAGAITYLLRDLYVRALYALGDGATPAAISLAAVALNAVLDWVAFFPLGLGSRGLVAATAAVNAASAAALHVLLRRRQAAHGCTAAGEPLRHLSALLRAIAAGSAAWAAGDIASQWLHAAAASTTWGASSPLLAALLGLAGGSAACVVAFAAACWLLRFRELGDIWRRRIAARPT
eukprot:jgi/Tetstr1/459660/TSEL_005016.t1